MPLDKNQIEHMEHLFASKPTVDIKVTLAGDLWIDGQEVIRNFTGKVGKEYIKLEVHMLRAIDKAEDRAIQRYKDWLAKRGIKVPEERPLFNTGGKLP